MGLLFTRRRAALRARRLVLVEDIEILRHRPRGRHAVAAGLVGVEGFSVDASLIKADVNPSKRVSGEQLDMRARDVTNTLELALKASGLEQAPVALRALSKQLGLIRV